jgi:beta-glucosidase
MDMNMTPLDYSFFDYCVNLTRKDYEFVKRVDDSVRRILRVKNQLGLFDNPYPVASDLTKIGTNDSELFNLNAARESIILAKNANNFLPLRDFTKKILVTGPSGNLLKYLGSSFLMQQR